jgi:hypothetical protein
LLGLRVCLCLHSHQHVEAGCDRNVVVTENSV